MRRIYATDPVDPSVRVPMQEVSLSDGAPVRLYDATGPYGDPKSSIDGALPTLRAPWISERFGTQLYAARRGWITTEMRFAALREGLRPDAVRRGIAEGRLVLPANMAHPACEPMLLGRAAGVKVGVAVKSATPVEPVLKAGADVLWVADPLVGRAKPGLVAKSPVPVAARWQATESFADLARVGADIVVVQPAGLHHTIDPAEVCDVAAEYDVVLALETDGSPDALDAAWQWVRVAWNHDVQVLVRTADSGPASAIRAGIQKAVTDFADAPLFARGARMVAVAPDQESTDRQMGAVHTALSGASLLLAGVDGLSTTDAALSAYRWAAHVANVSRGLKRSVERDQALQSAVSDGRWDDAAVLSIR
jgi:phosphomethylpyrimidine synthase